MTDNKEGKVPMLDLECRYRLSRFLHIRPVDNGLLVESVLSGRSQIVPSPSLVRLLISMMEAVRPRDLLVQVEETKRGMVIKSLEQFYENGLVTKVEESGKDAEHHSSLAHWEFHDLLFHVRSRRGRNPWPVGATYPLRGKVEPEPAFRNRGTSESIPLMRPDIARLSAQDISLTQALERRRSVYSTSPIAIAQLGEFLYRTCRTVDVQPAGDSESVIKKVYPGAGSLHPLEIYVVSWMCDGLPKGGYYYQAKDHLLVPVSDFTPEIEALLLEAQLGTGRLLGYPPLLLILSARFRRMSWKYQSIAYHLILQEVGALYQTMYLVATAMRLAPCALGAGDSDRFAEVFRTDYYCESSVGEFILGGLGD